MGILIELLCGVDRPESILAWKRSLQIPSVFANALSRKAIWAVMTCSKGAPW